MEINGSTRVAAVFGDPIAHTASPAMHNAAFAALGLNWLYIACHVDPKHLRAALVGARDMGFAGVNLTVPHKILALDIVDDADPEARQLGAVNTVVFDPSGRMRGFNTDGYGFVKALAEDFNLTLAGQRVLILGAGGVGRALAIQCALEGVAKLFLANRTAAKLDGLLRDLSVFRIQCRGLALTDVRSVLEEVDVIVNATSVGLKPGETLGLTPGRQHYVYDTIYNPRETDLLRVAKAAGAKTANGLSMLLYQGARAFELWTKQVAPIATMRQALQTTLYGARA